MSYLLNVSLYPVILKILTIFKKSAIGLINNSTYAEITVYLFTDSSTAVGHCHVITGTWSLLIRHIYHLFPDGSPSVKKENVGYGERV
jgi:hypothetical protein